MRRWFVRDFQSFELTEVLSFQEAEILARRYSKEEYASGLAEVVLQDHSGQFFVIGTFLRGKKRYQGRRSQFASDFSLPPTL